MTKPETSDATPAVQISLFSAFIPLIFLVALLALNVFIYGDEAVSGSNQFILLVGAAIAAVIGMFNNVRFASVMTHIADNIKSTSGAILILLMVGALAGSWLLSGVIPTMIYYGLQLLHPSVYLPATVLICAVIALATGSSWTTSATVGVALIGIGSTLGIPVGMCAGAVVSGAYFGDKLSPLSDTTNLAPAMAGTTLFTHVRYLLYTTVPTMTVTLIIFIMLGIFQDAGTAGSPDDSLRALDSAFVISPWLFLIPAAVILLIVRKTEPLIALFVGTVLAALFALGMQPELVASVGGENELTFLSAYKGVMNAITVGFEVPTQTAAFADLFKTGGMSGMMGTIWLILCAMAFGGAMQAIGALDRITKALLHTFTSIFGLFASTVASCLAINITASDQYLAILVPGKMFAQAYRDKGLAPENLSRTLEDAGTVTSPLIPWNTCGAYQAGVLGVSTFSYLPYAFFNLLSPFTTLLFAAFRIKIRQLNGKFLR